jgi:hypothetical protein
MLLVVLTGAVKSLDFAVRNAPLPAPASRFLHYFESLEEPRPRGLWERLTFSWLLSQGRGEPKGASLPAVQADPSYRVVLRAGGGGQP